MRSRPPHPGHPSRTSTLPLQPHSRLNEHRRRPLTQLGIAHIRAPQHRVSRLQDTLRRLFRWRTYPPNSCGPSWPQHGNYWASSWTRTLRPTSERHPSPHHGHRPNNRGITSGDHRPTPPGHHDSQHSRAEEFPLCSSVSQGYPNRSILRRALDTTRQTPHNTSHLWPRKRGNDLLVISHHGPKRMPNRVPRPQGRKSLWYPSRQHLHIRRLQAKLRLPQLSHCRASRDDHHKPEDPNPQPGIHIRIRLGRRENPPRRK
jgi:hypothetical protein